MSNQLKRVALALLLLPLGANAGAAARSGEPEPGDAPWYVQAMETKPLGAVESMLQHALADHPDDQQLWLALGTTRMLLAGEQVGQFLYRKGFRAPFPLMMLAPMVGMPVEANLDPEPVTMGELDAAIESWIQAFAHADEALAHVDDPNAKLRLHIGLVHMDFDADGELAESESLWRIFAQMRRNRRFSAEDARAFVIGFDGSDAAWMRGYAHVAMAAGEVALSLDYSEMFDRTGRLVFPKAEPRFVFLGNEGRGETPQFLDMIAMVHLSRMPVRDEGGVRRERALGHLVTMLEQSRVMFERVVRETDDDREWLPSPFQSGVLRNMEMSTQRMETWLSLLDELQAMLEGRKLAPYWRGRWPSESGVNVRRAVLESEHFDPILWIQGTDAVPYLEKGDLTDRDLWDTASRVFDFQLGRYAFWIN